MPLLQGLDFVEALLGKRCHVPHLALMSGTWSPADRTRAKRMGCQVFAKPFAIEEIEGWLATVETRISPDRGLLQWGRRARDRPETGPARLMESIFKPGPNQRTPPASAPPPTRDPTEAVGRNGLLVGETGHGHHTLAPHVGMLPRAATPRNTFLPPRKRRVMP